MIRRRTLPSASLPGSRARHVNDEDLRAVKLAGYDDAQDRNRAARRAQHLTNYINTVETDIDFPVVTAQKAA